jgi:hypothetical protein
MLKLEQNDLIHLNPESEEAQAYIDVDKKLYDIIMDFIVEPFGRSLNADIA